MAPIPHSYPFIPDGLENALQPAIQQAFLSQNPTLRSQLESQLAAQYGFTHASLMPSASSGFLFLLLALNIGQGDEVVLSAINCPSMHNMIAQVGATAVLADVRSTMDFRANAQTLSAAVSDKTKLLIVTHMFGAMISADEIQQLKQKYPNILILEDFSTVPFPVNALKVFSDFGLLSFGGTKPIAVGNGGAVLSTHTWFNQYYGTLQTQNTFNSHWSHLDLLVLQAQLDDARRQWRVRDVLKQFYLNHGSSLFGQEFGLFRAINFDGIERVEQLLVEYSLDLDIRSSVQPNLAKELNLELCSKLENAQSFQEYVSLPLNHKLYQILVERQWIEEVK